MKYPGSVHPFNNKFKGCQTCFIFAVCGLYSLLKNDAFPSKYKHTPNITPANIHVVKHQTNLNDMWKAIPCKDSVLPWAEAGVIVLDVVPARLACRAGRRVAWRFPWALVGAVAAEEAPSYNDETGSSPSNIQGTPEFIPVNNSQIKRMLMWK